MSNQIKVLSISHALALGVTLALDRELSWIQICVFSFGAGGGLSERGYVRLLHRSSATSGVGCRHLDSAATCRVSDLSNHSLRLDNVISSERTSMRLYITSLLLSSAISCKPIIIIIICTAVPFYDRATKSALTSARSNELAHFQVAKHELRLSRRGNVG